MSNVVRHQNQPLDNCAPKAYSSACSPSSKLFYSKSNGRCTGLKKSGGSSRHIAGSPDAGDVVPGSGGIRKVGWRRLGTGKSGGVRVIYYARTVGEEIVLLTLYAKSSTDNLTGAKLKEIRRVLES